MMIKPSVGRVVLYRGHPDEATALQGDQPCAAFVVYVWNDRLVNLAVFAHDGNHYPRKSVTLVQDGDEKPSGAYAEWMPYQKAVAKGEIAPTLHAVAGA
jgi:hypothetical protein